MLEYAAVNIRLAQLTEHIDIALLREIAASSHEAFQPTEEGGAGHGFLASYGVSCSIGECFTVGGGVYGAG